MVLLFVFRKIQIFRLHKKTIRVLFILSLERNFAYIRVKSDKNRSWKRGNKGEKLLLISRPEVDFNGSLTFDRYHTNVAIVVSDEFEARDLIKALLDVDPLQRFVKYFLSSRDISFCFCFIAVTQWSVESKTEHA